MKFKMSVFLDGVIPKSEMQLLDEISNVNFILFRLYTCKYYRNKNNHN